MARRLLQLMIGAAVAFFAINQIVTETFRVFLISEEVAMLVTLIIYARIASRHSVPGAALIVAGTLITLIAAAFQNNHAIELSRLQLAGKGIGSSRPRRTYTE